MNEKIDIRRASVAAEPRAIGWDFERNFGNPEYDLYAKELYHYAREGEWGTFLTFATALRRVSEKKYQEVTKGVIEDVLADFDNRVDLQRSYGVELDNTHWISVISDLYAAELLNLPYYGDWRRKVTAVNDWDRELQGRKDFLSTISPTANAKEIARSFESILQLQHVFPSFHEADDIRHEYLREVVRFIDDGPWKEEPARLLVADRVLQMDLEFFKQYVEPRIAQTDLIWLSKEKDFERNNIDITELVEYAGAAKRLLEYFAAENPTTEKPKEQLPAQRSY